ncbi:MAG: aminotransferase class I/II-fold pyridoxal phosphate-dependent enzyme [Planctomycetota bacterium]|jgi:8-amino-7-oxononanoate synthase/acyl carrier protein|nr:aminotransferase class I/II-fold pyridoxal phosphate-dependent enzyme [Blastopirellula sp.]
MLSPNEIKTEQPQLTITELLGPYSPPETTFLDRLQYWAAARTDDLAYRFIDWTEDKIFETTYAQLDQRARAIAVHLVSRGLQGKSALMMYPPGLDFVEALYGCYYAGVVPVPAYPPRRNRNMNRISAISEDAQAAAILTNDEVIRRSEPMLADTPALRRVSWIATELVRNEWADDWTKPASNPQDIGLIQYTSGSTGSPKGVVLTQQNLVANCRMISTAFQVNYEDSGANWLPFYHDMGLIGGILNPMFVGMASTLMSPIAFLTKPVRWLETISRFRATTCGGPNFAFALCTEKVTHEQCEGLDLSCWDLAFNGAEPVRASTLEAFSRKFEPYGFRHTAHYPCYGMAEASLIVTGGIKGEEPIIRTFDRQKLTEHKVVQVPEDSSRAQRMVGCGRVLEGETLVIVHPEKFYPLPEGEIGEIWISSPSVGKGYWNKREETQRTFRATLAMYPDKFFLRSGDLGFINRGELFVTGRLKDMIIIRGVNRYPQDIEATAESAHDRLRSGGAAAFAVEHWDREHLIVVCEVERGPEADLDPLIETVRRTVTEQHEIPPDAIVLVRPNSVPKTSSGKVQRHACRQAYLQNELMVLKSWRADGAAGPGSREGSQSKATTAAAAGQRSTVEIVMQYVRHVGRERARNLTPQTNIVLDLGLDSLERMEIARHLENAYGGRFPDEVLQEIETITEVAEAIERHLGTQLKSTTLPGEESPKSASGDGPLPESYYIFEKTPEFVRLQRSKEQVARTGLRNPYFSVHEGVIADTTRIEGRELVSFSSYNYLGLSGTREVSDSAKQAIDQFGTSVSASRLVSGEKTIHKQLERELSEFLGVEDVITFPGGHATNESVIGHLVGPGDLILHDSLAHNSIIQGAELSGARRRAFEHNDWLELDRVLKEIRRDYRRVLVAIEGLYSMDGDYPDLPKFVEVKRRHKCWLYVDEAHSIGTMGATGRGIGEFYGVSRREVECWMGTLSKSFGSCGGFVGGSANLIDYLRYTTPGYVFAAGIPPANVGAALGALRSLRASSERVQRLQANSARFLGLAKAAGLDTGPSQNSPIIPVLTGSSVRALALSEGLYRSGVNAQPILHPAVPEEQARVRFFITAAHRPEQIDQAVDTIAKVWSGIKRA